MPADLKGASKGLANLALDVRTTDLSANEKLKPIN